MFGLVEGKFLSFLMLILLSLFGVISYYMCKRGRLPELRRIAALDAMAEAVGRVTEMGRPVFFTSGKHGLRDSYAPSMIAGTALLNYTASMCANLGIPLYVTIGVEEVYPLQFAQVRDAYLAEGKIDEFVPDNIVFTGLAYAIQTIGMIERLRPGAFFLMGRPHVATILMTETANHVGAIQVAGCTNFSQTAFMVATCDYVKIGDEILAAGAYLTKDVGELSRINAGDFGKYLSLGMLIGFMLLLNVGVDAIMDLFKW